MKPLPAIATLSLTQRRIGVTGGIATGKTMVSRYLALQYQLPVLDADVYARDAVTPPAPILAHICDRYGSTILQPDGQLNRSRLGQIIFQDAAERRWLEAHIHPYVRDRIVNACTQHPGTVVIVVPLLFEAKMTDLVSEIWVVTCTPAQQQQRLMARDGLTEQQSCDRINSQMPLAEKIARADVVLDNAQDEARLKGQIDQALGVGIAGIDAGITRP